MSLYCPVVAMGNSSRGVAEVYFVNLGSFEMVGLMLLRLLFTTVLIGPDDFIHGCGKLFAVSRLRVHLTPPIVTS